MDKSSIINCETGWAGIKDWPLTLIKSFQGFNRPHHQSELNRFISLSIQPVSLKLTFSGMGLAAPFSCNVTKSSFCSCSNAMDAYCMTSTGSREPAKITRLIRASEVTLD